MTQKFLTHLAKLPLAERMSLMEAFLQSSKLKIQDPEAEQKKAAEWEEVLRRRREFVIPTFDLGCDVIVDRDEIYAERGL